MFDAKDLKKAMSKMTAEEKRKFKGEITIKHFDGKSRKAKEKVGRSEKTVELGMNEFRTGISCYDLRKENGRVGRENKDPVRRKLILEIVDPEIHADPEVKTTKLYVKMTAKEVNKQLKEKGFDPPAERTMQTILNRMGLTLKAVKKCTPLKKNTGD